MLVGELVDCVDEIVTGGVDKEEDKVEFVKIAVEVLLTKVEVKEDVVSSVAVVVGDDVVESDDVAELVSADAEELTEAPGQTEARSDSRVSMSP